MKDALISELKALFSENQICINEAMSEHTTFRVGGNADILVKPSEIEQLKRVLKLCEAYEEPYYIIGNGSNLLVSDSGIRGVVIEFGKDFSELECIENERIRVQAGCMLAKVANAAMHAAYTGMEFAAGIPGTVGGAVMMNAGAYGGEMKDIVECVTMLTPEGEIVECACEEMDFGYRHSIVSERNYIVLEVIFKLSMGNIDDIKVRMQELAEARRSKQPLEYPSAGSTFKRPEGYFAGKLIMDAGLAGYHVGDAEVSAKHCGFVINRGHATAKDIITLMNDVIIQVETQFGVRLEPEVRKVGEFE